MKRKFEVQAKIRLEEIEEEIVLSKKEQRDFSFSISKKQELVGEFGVEKVVEALLTAIRKHKIQLIDDIETVNESLIKRVKKASADDKIIAKDAKWAYKLNKIDVEQSAGSTLLKVSPSSMMFSTALNGFERYSSKIAEKNATPQELWDRDDILRKAIKYVCTHPKKSKTEALSRNRLRVFCMQGNGCKYPTAFPIPVAMWIYKREAALRPNKRLTCVIDPCAGWGDRLAAAMLVGEKVVEQYVGIDPWKKSNELCAKIGNLMNGKNYNIISGSATSDDIEWPDADLCFTSPPYGKLECYNIDAVDKNDGQAWRLDDFVRDFIRPFLKNAKKATLAKKGRIIINLGNTPKSPKLTESLLKEAKSIGLQHAETFGMRLSVRAPKTTFDHAAPVFRGEPFFVFTL